MAGWVTAPSGAKVWQDDSGLVHVKDAGGMVTAIKPTEAARYLSDKDSGYSPASADELNAAHEAAAKAAEEAKTSTLGAFARGAAGGVITGALAAPKLVTGLGAAALGVQDPLADYSGSGFVQDVGTAARYAGGESIGKAETESREQMMADREQHGFAHGAGELAGTVVGSAPLGGLAGGAGKAAAGALGLAGRAATVVGATAGSTLEGAGLGAAAAAEPAWLKNQPVTAEQTLAGIGLGGLFGAAAGGTFATAGPALAKFLGRGAKAEATGLEGAALRAEGEIGSAEAAAVPGKATMAVDEAVAPAALESVPDTLGAKARRYISGLGDDAAVKQIAHDQKPALRSLGMGGPPSTELLRDAGKFLNESGIAGLGSDTAALDRATVVAEGAGQKIGAIMQKMDESAPYVDARPMVNKLQDFAAELKSNSWTPEQDAIAKKIMERTTKIEQLADAGIVTHSDLWNYRRGLDTLSGWGKTAPNATKEAMRELRGMVESQLEKSITEGGHMLGSDAGAEYLQAKRAYRFGTWAKDTLEERVGVRNTANNLLGLKDYGVGLGALVASGGSALPALGAAVGTKIIRERGWGTLAWLARRAAADAVDVSAAPAAATGTARAVQTMVARSESHIGDSIGRFLGTGAASGSGLARGGGRATTAAALRSSDLTTAQNAYRDHAREVQTVASVPDVAASRLQSITGQTLPVVAPGLHTAMAATAMKAAGYLSQNLPCAPSDPDSITPQLDSPPPASRADLHTYANRVEGVEDPLSLLDDLNKGHVPPEKVEAVKAVWPELFARMRQTTFDHLAQRTEKQGPVPYHERQLLDLALDGGGALEPSLRPDSLAVMQQAQQWQAQQLKQKAPRPASGGSPKLGNMLQTSTDRIAAR